MTLPRKLLFSIGFFLLLFITGFTSFAKVQTTKYGLPVFSDSVAAVINFNSTKSLDSLLKAHPQTGQQHTVYAITHARKGVEKTVDFYLLLFLVLLLGLIRLMDPKYFQTLWVALKNPILSNRQLKDKLQNASMPNMLMNLFFTISAAAYIFYLVRDFMSYKTGYVPPYLLMLILIAGMITIYAGKYAVIKFSGWAFRVEGITEQYLFNVFLINKILSIVLLPFIVVLAFSDPEWTQPALIISIIIIIILFINRYMRSWQVFGSFFQYSKFHFFTYLCASELLPLAVLMKLLVRGFL